MSLLNNKLEHALRGIFKEYEGKVGLAIEIAGFDDITKIKNAANSISATPLASLLEQSIIKVPGGLGLRIFVKDVQTAGAFTEFPLAAGVVVDNIGKLFMLNAAGEAALYQKNDPAGALPMGAYRLPIGILREIRTVVIDEEDVLFGRFQISGVASLVLSGATSTDIDTSAGIAAAALAGGVPPIFLGPANDGKVEVLTAPNAAYFLVGHALSNADTTDEVKLYLNIQPMPFVRVLTVI